jgi:hypothetical protein
MEKEGNVTTLAYCRACDRLQPVVDGGVLARHEKPLAGKPLPGTGRKHRRRGRCPGSERPPAVVDDEAKQGGPA